MKNYFNQEERIRHLIIMSAIEISKTLTNSKALSPDEKKYLKLVNTYLSKFNDSIFERFGEAYRRKLQGLMECNKLSLVGKYEKSINAVNQCVTDDMMPLIKSVRSWKCLTCERNDHLNCFIYNACITCDVEATGDGEECPFKM